MQLRFFDKILNTKDLRKYNKRKKMITKAFTRCEDLILEFSNDDKSSEILLTVKLSLCFANYKNLI